jgi:hypothetical protein
MKKRLWNWAHEAALSGDIIVRPKIRTRRNGYADAL